MIKTKKKNIAPRKTDDNKSNICSRFVENNHSLPVSSFLCWLLGSEELLSAELGVPRALHEARCRRCDAKSEI